MFLLGEWMFPIKRFITTTVLLSCLLVGYAQCVYRYRVSLTDKLATEYSLAYPKQFLSDKALQRRAKQSLSVDSTDLPVCKYYLHALSQKGVQPVCSSKWNNTVLVECTDTTQLASIKELPFVRNVQKVWKREMSVSHQKEKRIKVVKERDLLGEDYYGTASCQVKMLNVDKLHALGYWGDGITIAVIDGGFYNADVVGSLKDCRIVGTRNFVNSYNVFEENEHGLKVLSCMASNNPYIMVGTSPKASYWLLCSEDNDSESLVEEDYWASAIEFADSVGVDVVNSSLGYTEFDDKSTSYTYSQLDGHFALISNSASMVANKGMVLVCSAGNEGDKSWKKISIPADAEHVLTVGSVDRNRINSQFSSIGNTADGRVKPDVMALGDPSAVVSSNGLIEWIRGTSFAAPTVCGAIACLWQAFPTLSAKQLIALVCKASHQYGNPDNVYGYGIPDFIKAYRMALESTQKTLPKTDELK